MTKYAFLIGRKPWISLAELQAVLPDAKFLELTGETVILENEKIENPQAFLNTLGGTIKIIEITDEPIAGRNVHKPLSLKVLQRFKNHEGKARYAIFVQTLKGTTEQTLKSALIETKKLLKSEGLSSRFINNNFRNAEIAHLKGERILEKGGEFCALETTQGWLIGQTVAIQDIDAYSDRDYNRPERDARVGMLPPKLAQILINLTGQHQLNTPVTDKLIYDPFCGLGTVLMEGMLMGFNVLGSDITPEVLHKAQKNVAWIEEKSGSKVNTHLFIQDAGQLSQGDFRDPVSAVVSETYLGPPMSHTPTPEQINSVFAELHETIANFFDALSTVVTEDTPIVLTLLTYRNTSPKGPRYFQMDGLLEVIRELGFEQQDLLSEDLIEKFKLPEDTQKTLLYERPDQIVCRAIYKFQLK